MPSESRQSFNSSETLIVGRNGRLARAFRHLFPQARALGRADIDIACNRSVEHTLRSYRPKIVVNCAAITDLTLCEREPESTRRVNVSGVQYLTEHARRIGAVVVHFSSDYATDPVNEYASAKLDSEGYADLTIRAKIYDGTHWAWEALRNGRTIDMTTEEFSNPISTTGVASLVPVLLRKSVRGVRELGSRDRLNFFEVGRIWAVALGVSPGRVRPIGRIVSPYRRPTDTFLPCEDLDALGLRAPPLDDDAAEHRALFERYGL